MNQYITDRLDPQIEWYEKKATYNQRCYKYVSTTEILLLLGIIPAALFIQDETTVRSITILASAIASIFFTIQKLFKFQENWVNYRQTAELLKSEKSLALAHAGIYTNTDNIYPLLAERAEAIMTKEHNNWSTLSSQKTHIHSSNAS